MVWKQKNRIPIQSWEILQWKVRNIGDLQYTHHVREGGVRLWCGPSFYDNELAATTPTWWLLKRKSSSDCRSRENLRTCCRRVLINCTSLASLLSQHISWVNTHWCADESFYSNLSLVCNLHHHHPPLKISRRKELPQIFDTLSKFYFFIFWTVQCMVSDTMYSSSSRHISAYRVIILQVQYGTGKGYYCT
jgi:hypothetical protein